MRITTGDDTGWGAQYVIPNNLCERARVLAAGPHGRARRRDERCPGLRSAQVVGLGCACIWAFMRSAICSGLRSSLWVATPHMRPDGSTTAP